MFSPRLRLYLAGPSHRGRLRYALGPLALVDLMTVAPVWALESFNAMCPTIGGPQAGQILDTVRTLRVFRAFRLMRLVRLAPGRHAALKRQLFLLIFSVGPVFFFRLSQKSRR